MATIRTIPARHNQACVSDNCGGVMQPATRFEARKTIDVWICWRCGREDPPLYRRATTVRNGRAVDPERALTKTCRWCSSPFRVWRNDITRYCSMSCANRAAVVSTQRRSDGRIIGRKPA